MSTAIKPKYDNWGNLLVWLPVGKPCTIKDPTHTYTVDATAIADYRSLKTAVGLPICIGHPDSPITPHNPAPTVGTSLGEIRPTPDGGVEIECKITDKGAIELVNAKKLVEVSPCYEKVGLDGVRIYNHLAILPKGYAKGGSKMAIKFEGNPIKNIMTPEDIKSICEGMKSMFEGMEKESKEMESKMEEACKESKCEGYAEGVSAAKWLIAAKSEGYDGIDVVEAKAAILTAKYPDLKTESYSVEMIEGLLLAATILAPVKVSVIPEPISIPVPKVVMEGQDSTVPTSRYKNYVPKLKV